MIGNAIFARSQDRKKTFVLDGTFESHTEEEITAQIKEYGGKVENDLSLYTDFLVVGKNPTKQKQAMDFGVQLMREDQLYRFIKTFPSKGNTMNLKLTVFGLLLVGLGLLAGMKAEPAHAQEAANGIIVTELAGGGSADAGFIMIDTEQKKIMLYKVKYGASKKALEFIAARNYSEDEN